MNTYRFESTNPEGDKLVMEFNAVQLSDLCEQFDLFLKGCGFQYDGEVTIEEEIEKPFLGFKEYLDQQEQE